jgi:peptidoglycan/xylan/chitin deacetylase (PgdA/CDA1 family)
MTRGLDLLTSRLLRAPDGTGRRGLPAPIALMYHATPADRRAGGYAVSADNFLAQVELLQALDAKFTRACDLGPSRSIADNTICLTFDDGYVDNLQGAFRVLADRNLPATWFVVTGAVGGTAHWHSRSADRAPLLGAAALREMHAAGMELGSHSRSHPDLTRVDDAQLAAEIGGSRADLEDLIGTRVTCFAYPFGRMDARVRGEVAKAGYEVACATASGSIRAADDRLALRRVTVTGSDSLAQFARKLALATNDGTWFTLMRYLAKRLRARWSPTHA